MALSPQNDPAPGIGLGMSCVTVPRAEAAGASTVGRPPFAQSGGVRGGRSVATGETLSVIQ